jgi:hypothetical protein
LRIFINDIPVYILSREKIEDKAQYDLILEDKSQPIVPKKLYDDVLIMDADPSKVEEFLELITDKKFLRYT